VIPVIAYMVSLQGLECLGARAGVFMESTLARPGSRVPR